MCLRRSGSMSNKEMIQLKYNEDLEYLHSALNNIMKSDMLPEGEVTGGGAGDDGFKEDGVYHSYPYTDIELKYRGLFYDITIRPSIVDYTGIGMDDEEIGDMLDSI